MGQKHLIENNFFRKTGDFFKLDFDEFVYFFYYLYFRRAKYYNTALKIGNHLRSCLIFKNLQSSFQITERSISI